MDLPRPRPASTVATLLVLAVPAGATVVPQEDGPPPPSTEAEAAPEWPLTLDEALVLALRDNLGLVRSDVEAQAARYDALSAWGSFDWVFDASASFTDSEREGTTTLFGGDRVTSTSEQLALDLTKPFRTGGTFTAHFDTDVQETTSTFSLFGERFSDDNIRFSYTQPLLRNAWREYTTSTQREAEVEERRQREVQRGVRQTLVFDVEVAYWDLVAAAEQVEVAESALELARRQVEQEGQRLDVGDGTEVDVIQAQATEATRIEELLQARNAVQESADALKRLLLADDEDPRWSLVPTAVTPLPADVEAPDVPGWEEAFRTAMEYRSELRQNRLRVDAARLRHARARSEKLSLLDLELSTSSNASDNNAGRAFSDTTSFEFPQWSVLLRYSVPIGNRAAANAERAARERVRVSLVEYDEAELDVLADVRAAVRDVGYRFEAVRAAQQSLQLAERQLDAEQRRYEADLSTTFRVLEFQQTYVEALQSERAARVEFVKSLVGIERAQGRLGERRP